MRSAPVAIWSTDAGGVVRSWNDMAERLFGWPAAEVVGRPAPFASAGPEPVGPAGGPWRAPHRDGHDLDVLVSSTELRIPDDPGQRTLTVWFASETVEITREHGLPPETEHGRWRRILPCIADAVIITDARGLIREVATDISRILGHAHTIVGSSAFTLLHHSEIERAWSFWAQVLENPSGAHREVFRTGREGGHDELVEYTTTNLLGDPLIQGIVTSCRIVTTQNEGEELVASEADVLDLVARDAPLATTLTAIGRIVEDHTGGSAGILLLRPDAREFEIGAAGATPPALLERLRRAPLTPSLTFDTIDFRRVTFIGDLRSDRRTAHLVPATGPTDARSAWTLPIIGSHTDELLGLIAVFRRSHQAPTDHERRAGESASRLAAIAIDRHRRHDQLWHQARHDDLTGLPNRPSILEHLDAALATPGAVATSAPDGSGDHRVVVVFVDIDRFKAVNDSYGHAAGDKLLVRFAVRLRNVVGAGDLVGRFGADEFVIVLTRAAGLADARLVSNRIDLALSEPFSLEEGEIYLTTSLGVAQSTGAESGIELIQHADAAVARAKELGRDRMEVFDHVMRTQAEEQLRVDRELRAGIDRHELVLHYQPIITLATGAPAGAEALLRWEHPTAGLLLPEHFLPVSEDAGTIVRIGRWVIERAIEQAREWLDRHPHLEPFSISVNVSPHQLSSPGFVEHVGRTIERHGWPADQLVLDLAEGMLLEDRDTSLAVLSDLKALGVSLALDDFGTGFSSLNELHRFPLDAVKIDPSFVESLRVDGSGSPVVTAVLHMAHDLGLLVVAEGVERADQHAGLRRLDCDHAQGLFFSPSGPPEEIEKHWLTIDDRGAPSRSPP